MPLHLVIENETSLPDGGPVAFTVNAKRGIDIGRDQHLDWVLPDPTRFVSGKHCEIRYKDGQYWLTDVSTNGTFMNRGEFRIDRPHALQNGDRIEIGKYHIAVTLEPDQGVDASGHVMQPASPGDNQFWDMGGEAPPAINPRELRAPPVASGANSFDVLDWAADIASVDKSASAMPGAYEASAAPAPRGDIEDWTKPAQSAPAPAPFQPPLEVQAPVSIPQPTRPAVSPASPALPSSPAFAWDIEGEAPKLAQTQPPDAPVQAAAPAVTAPPMPAPFAPMPVTAPPVAAPAVTAQAPPPPSAPPRAPAPAPQASAPRRATAGGEFIKRFAKGAGLPEETLQARDEGELAELLGVMMRSVAENLRQLHAARAQSKGMMRSANQTMIQALDNNPLRFSPNAVEALRIMFGPPSASYLDPHRTLESSFTDLKKHQMMTFSAMQMAISRLAEDLDPKVLDARIDPDKGVSALLGSRKAKLWDHYVTVWQAKTGKSEQGMLGVFMLLFADAYDKSG